MFLFIAAVDLQAQPKLLDEGSVRSLGEKVNSEHDEFAPVLTLDEDLLFFTSDRPSSTGEGDLDVFYSEREKSGDWSDPEELPVNTEKDEVSVGISADGKILILQKGGDLYKVEKDKEGWKQPEPFGPAINSEHQETHGSLSADGKTFYFVSDRSGNKDIYRVKELPTGDWSKAKKLPGTINTTEDEHAPFIHPDEKTLFFSSEGHDEEGDADIFYSKRDEESGGWSEPVNMGYPVSTDGRNIHIMTSADGQRAYFSSWGIEEEQEDRDLYRVDLEKAFTEGLAVLKGFVEVPNGSDLLDSVSIQVHPPEGMNNGDPTIYRPRERDGVYIAVLPPCQKYKLEHLLVGRTVAMHEVHVPCNSSYQEIHKEVFVRPLDIRTSMLNRLPRLSGRVMHSNKVPVSQGRIQLIGTEGEVQDRIRIGEKGSFRFFLAEEGFEKIRFRMEKEGSCDHTELILNVDGKVWEPVEQEGCDFFFKPEAGLGENLGEALEYKEHFGYNSDRSDKGSYEEMLGRIQKRIEKDGKVTVHVEGSASKVPTSSFSSNKSLAKRRASKMVRTLKRRSRANDLPLKKIRFETEAKVQGPAYEKGMEEDEFIPYQYVSVRIP